MNIYLHIDMCRRIFADTNIWIYIYIYIYIDIYCIDVYRRIFTDTNNDQVYTDIYRYNNMKTTVAPVWWTRVDIDLLLSLILAFSTDLKRIQTPHGLFWDFGADKTSTIHWSGGTRRGRLLAEFKFEYKFEPLQVIWESLPKAIPEDNRRFWLRNQWPSSWGRSPAQLARVGRANTHRDYPSRRQSPRAATGSTCNYSCDTDSVPESKRFQCFLNFGPRRVTFFSCEMRFSMELARCCCRPKQRPSLCSIVWSFIGLWVEMWHRNKTACSKSNPVQSTRSKLTTTSVQENAQIRIEQYSDFRWRRAKA